MAGGAGVSAPEVLIEGARVFGAPTVLLSEDDDLTARAPWREHGYTIAPFLSPELSASLRRGIEARIWKEVERCGIRIDRGASLERYHRSVGLRPGAHERIVKRLNKLPYRRLPIPPSSVSERIAAICGVPLTIANPYYGMLAGLASVFGIRIVRPLSNDHNPLHRDVWLDRLRHAINIYVPLAGSDERSCLCVVPGSHRWREDEIERTQAGARVNGRRYTVPAVTGARRSLSVLRPSPGADEVLVFSPYLIHGGASNLNPDTTRVSLEMRFWRKRPRRRP